jgi:lipopolysaccharide transport system permease protein
MAEQASEQHVIIEAGGKNLQYWKDLWRYRSLALHFALRDFTVRYKQTVIGFAWSLINPLVNTVVLSFVFGSLAGFNSETEIPYNICVYAGLLPWGLFSRTVSSGSNVFLSGAGIMQKVYFPRLIIPLATAASALLDTLISYLILFVFMGLYRYMPPLRILWSFLLLVPIALLGIFLGVFISSYTIRFRDLHYIVPFVLSIGQYVTPVAYTMADMEMRLGEQLKPLYQVIYYINPMSGFEAVFKWAVLRDQVFDVRSLAVSFIWLGVALALGIIRFRKSERTFVDIV